MCVSVYSVPVILSRASHHLNLAMSRSSMGGDEINACREYGPQRASYRYFKLLLVPTYLMLVPYPHTKRPKVAIKDQKLKLGYQSWSRPDMLQSTPKYPLVFQKAHWVDYDYRVSSDHLAKAVGESGARRGGGPARLPHENKFATLVIPISRFTLLVLGYPGSVR